MPTHRLLWGFVLLLLRRKQRGEEVIHTAHTVVHATEDVTQGAKL